MGPGRGGLLRSAAGRWWPEILVGVLACATFLGCMGSVELWGKREQRAAAEALDTVANGHWLVAEIQGRPRLEKPPLPRWTIAGLLALTGRREEWVVRLPSALSGLACVALVYALGRRIGGRELGLASAIILGTTGLFISELRQAGNDGPLAACTALAIFAARRRIDKGSGIEEDAPGGRGWAVLFHIAMGLGFLCKGPIVLLLVGVTILPYLALTRRLRRGLARLWDLPGALAFLTLAIAWPALVLAVDPQALGVWTTEMGQKTGALPLAHQERGSILLAFPLMMLPWAVVGIAGVALPFRADRGLDLAWRRGDAWLPWCWAIGNLGVLGTWAVAKPNYFVPCEPGLAILGGMAWLRLDALARRAGRPESSRRATALLHLQWCVLALAGLVVAMVCRKALTTTPIGWLALLAALTPPAAALGGWARKRALGAASLLPAAAASAVGVLIGYGILARGDNLERGHRRLAEEITRLAPAHGDAPELRFFHEIDEGLWFYLRDRRLSPVPGSQPRYSDSFDKLGDALASRPSRSDAAAIASRFEERQRQILRDWIDHPPPDAEATRLLIRVPLLRRWSPDLAGRAAPLLCEENRKRTPLALLRVSPGGNHLADTAR